MKVAAFGALIGGLDPRPIDESYLDYGYGNGRQPYVSSGKGVYIPKKLQLTKKQQKVRAKNKVARATRKMNRRNNH